MYNSNGIEESTLKLKKTELQYFLNVCDEIIYEKPYTDMKLHIAHGFTSTYDHCINVAYYSFLISCLFSLKIDRKSLIKGSLLHDLYLYDWHHKDASHAWHGFIHAKTANDNACKYYEINALEKQIILNHMWPLNLYSVPKSKEAILVCIIDKIVSICESIPILRTIYHKKGVI